MIRRLRIFVFAVGLIIAIIFPLVITRNEYLIHMVILIFYYGSLALAWNIIGGYAGQLSLGHAGYVGIAAYVSLMLLVFFGIPIWVGMVVSFAAVALFSIFIGYPCFKLRGPYFALSTLAVAEAFKSLVMYFDTYTGGTFGLWVPALGSHPSVGFYQLERIHEGSPLLYLQFEGKLPYYYMFLIMFMVCICVSYLIGKSDFGLILRAIKDDQDAANALGVSVHWMKIKALILSAVLTGGAAVVYVMYITYIEPISIFGLDLSITPVVLSTIGGLATTPGPIIGTLLFVPISEYVRAVLGGTYVGAHLILYGIVVVAVILLIPDGIYGELKKRFPSIAR